MFHYQGKTALITGASAGIGRAFAQELAKRGMNVILVARSSQQLYSLASDLHQTYGIRAEVVVADLSLDGAAAMVYKTVQERQLQVDLLINNAGFINYAPFESIAPDRDRAQVMVNITAVVDLTHTFIPDMLARGSGAVLNVASNGAFYPMPYMAVYAATKAFVLSFSEALWAEYRMRGLRVLALCPGPTKTNALLKEFDNGKAAAPEYVVKAALKALDEGRSYIVPGLANSFQARILPRLLPRYLMVRVVERITRPKR
jgi:uncharacterized protein